MMATEDTALQTCRNIVRVASLLRKDLDSVFAEAGLSGPQFGILVQLDSGGKMPLGDLGKRLWVSCGNVTGLVDKLAASGLVKRTRDASDRRVVFAELTEEGRRLVRRLRPVHRDHILRFTSTLDGAELAQLQSLLDRVLAAAAGRDP